MKITNQFIIEHYGFPYIKLHHGSNVISMHTLDDDVIIEVPDRCIYYDPIELELNIFL